MEIYNIKLSLKSFLKLKPKTNKNKDHTKVKSPKSKLIFIQSNT